MLESVPHCIDREADTKTRNTPGYIRQGFLRTKQEPKHILQSKDVLQWQRPTHGFMTPHTYEFPFLIPPTLVLFLFYIFIIYGSCSQALR